MWLNYHIFSERDLQLYLLILSSISLVFQLIIWHSKFSPICRSFVYKSFHIFWYLFLSLKTSEGTWISSLAWRCLSRLPSDVYVFRGPEIGGKAINRCEGDGPGQVQSTVERWGHLLAICSPDSSTIVTLQDQALTLIQFKSWRPFYF